MQRWISGLLILFTMMVLIPPVYGEEDLPEPRILVLFSESNPVRARVYGAEKAVMMENLLGHFSAQVTCQRIEDYVAGQLEIYDGVVVLGVKEQNLPDELLQDVGATAKPVLWMGGNLDQVAPHLGLEGVGSRFYHKKLTLYYKGQKLVDERKSVFWEVNLPETGLAGEVKVWAWGEREGSFFPLAWQRGNFWYMGTVDFLLNTYWVMADLLHQVLGQEHGEEHLAVIRLEDVHPLHDPAKLRAVADYLASERVPFMVAVIPNYVNPATGREVTLAERPEVGEALRYMVEKGGSLVLHGYTHQMGDEETGLGFEFWDSINDRPIEHQEEQYVMGRLERGIRELAAQELYPLAFEPPHYAMSETGYKLVQGYFTTLAGCVQVSDRTRMVAQKFPYLIHRDCWGMRVIPENMGLVDVSLNAPVASMLKEAQELLVVRDGMAGAIYHPFLDIAYLKEIVAGLKALGYAFYDLKQEENMVAASGLVITSGEGRLEVVEDAAWERLPLPRLKKFELPAVAPMDSWVVAGAAAMILLLLIQLPRGVIYRVRSSQGRK